MAERDIRVHQNHNGNEIRSVSFEKVAALPAVPMTQGQFLQVVGPVNAGLWYASTPTDWVRVITGVELNLRPRFVGAVDVSSGIIPLITPNADLVDGSTNWDSGDTAVVSVAGVLVPAPSYGSANVSVGDQIVCISAGVPGGNADFMVIETNAGTAPPSSFSTIVLPTDWVGGPGAWEVPVALPGSGDLAKTVFTTDVANNVEVFFGVERAAGVVKLTATTVVSPPSKYTFDAII